MGNAEKEDRKRYGKTLIALASKVGHQPFELSANLNEDKRNMKERLKMLTKAKCSGKKAVILSTILLTAAVTITVATLLVSCTKSPSSKQMNASNNSGFDGISSNSNSNVTSNEEKSILKKYTTSKILFFQSFPIGSGQNAAFAIVTGQNSYQGDVWYITAGAQKLKNNVFLTEDNTPDTPYIWTIGNIKIFKCESSGASASTSYAWYIKDGKPIELPNTGMDLSYIGNGQFTTIDSDFDYGLTDGSWAGHTYKIYYLYWTNDGLKEYGGLKITQQQLLKVNGAQAVINVITQSGHTIDDIFYRANNIININYHSGDKSNGDFDNITLEYKNNAVTPVLVDTDSNSSKTESLNMNNLNKYSYGGVYKTALFSQIATYPNKFSVN